MAAKHVYTVIFGDNAKINVTNIFTSDSYEECEKKIDELMANVIEVDYDHPCTINVFESSKVGNYSIAEMTTDEQGEGNLDIVYNSEHFYIDGYDTSYNILEED